MCNPAKIGDCVADGARSWFNEQVRELTVSLVQSMVALSGEVATAWVELPLMPKLGEWTGGGVCDPATGVCTAPTFRESQIFQFFTYHLGWWSMALLVLGLILSGMRIIWAQNGAELRDLLKTLLVYAAITGFGVAAVFTLVNAGDEFSSYILDRAAPEEDFAAAIARVLFLPADVTGAEESYYVTGALGMILGIILLLISVLVFVVQVILLVIRGALLVVMVAMLPVAAAAGTTMTGKQMLGKYLAWLLALILYKPAAAILYAAAFQLTSTTGGESILAVLSGLTIFVAALFMLPALLRLIVPAAGAVASGAGTGGLIMAGAGAAAATGAVALKTGAAAATGGSSAGLTAAASGSGGAPSGGRPGGGAEGASPAPGEAAATGGASPAAAASSGTSQAGAGASGSTAAPAAAGSSAHGVQDPGSQAGPSGGSQEASQGTGAAPADAGPSGRAGTSSGGASTGAASTVGGSGGATTGGQPSPPEQTAGGGEVAGGGTQSSPSSAPAGGAAAAAGGVASTPVGSGGATRGGQQPAQEGTGGGEAGGGGGGGAQSSQGPTGGQPVDTSSTGVPENKWVSQGGGTRQGPAGSGQSGRARSSWPEYGAGATRGAGAGRRIADDTDPDVSDEQGGSGPRGSS